VDANTDKSVKSDNAANSMIRYQGHNEAEPPLMQADLNKSEVLPRSDANDSSCYGKGPGEPRMSIEAQ
jgi:hypothetical protein